jgi:hypothetical protein
MHMTLQENRRLVIPKKGHFSSLTATNVARCYENLKDQTGIHEHVQARRACNYIANLELIIPDHNIWDHDRILFLISYHVASIRIYGPHY